MVPPEDCPNIDRLQQFAVGKTPEEEGEYLIRHLARCPRCLQTMQTLKLEDSLIVSVQAQADRPKKDTLLPEGLIDRLKEFWPAESREEDRAAQLYGLLAPPVDAGEIGRLGPYRVLGVLGIGGMGVVFRAEDTQLKRRVALKMMKPSRAIGDSTQRFLREAQAAAAMHHDNIVPIYHIGVECGFPFLTMPLLEGETLEDRLRREGRLPVADVLRVAREIAQGLAVAHQQGVIHCDIKPANIWLERVEEEREFGAGEGVSSPAPTTRVRILDFGLARAAVGESDVSSLGAILGTPAYMAPEQVRGLPLDHRCDLFALGCVLYRACTGKLPFEANRVGPLLRAIECSPPESPRQLNPDIPLALSNLIESLLAKNPQDRPESSRAVVQALATMPPRIANASQKSHRQWLLAVAALVLLTGGIWLLAGVISTMKRLGESGPVSSGTKGQRSSDLEVAKKGVGPVSLFNGKNLAGWKAFDGSSGGWKVEDGVLVGDGTTAYLFSERGDLEDFHFRAEVQINDGGDSGIYFRSPFVPHDIQAYQAQINATHDDPQKTGSLYNLGEVRTAPHATNEWFKLEIIAQGDWLTIKVNGKTTVSLEDKRFKKGHLALQRNSPPTVVKFREMEVEWLRAKVKGGIPVKPD